LPREAAAAKLHGMATPLSPESARLRLRPWRDADLPALAAINADPAVMRYFHSVMDRAESDAWGARQQSHIDEYGWGFWAVEHRATAALIGAVGLMHIPWEAPFTPAVEIGWRIATAHQRQGFAEEAARLALEAGFGPIGLEEIVAFTVPANAPSRALMTKLGMAADGGFEHPRLPPGHPFRPHLLYRLPRAAWMG